MRLRFLLLFLLWTRIVGAARRQLQPQNPRSLANPRDPWHVRFLWANPRELPSAERCLPRLAPRSSQRKRSKKAERKELEAIIERNRRENDPDDDELLARRVSVPVCHFRGACGTDIFLAPERENVTQEEFLTETRPRISLRHPNYCVRWGPRGGAASTARPPAARCRNASRS